MKNVVGYDLTQLLVGSEGTLAIVTQIILRLMPKPPAVATLRACFADVPTAARAVSALIRRRIVPVTLELVDKDSLDAAVTYAGTRLAPEGTGALLLVEVDGVAEAVAAEAAEVEAGCREVGALEVLVARDDAEREHLWRIRRELVLRHSADRAAQDQQRRRRAARARAGTVRAGRAAARHATACASRRSDTPATATSTSTS